MSRLYGLALRLLPAELRRKHGPSMEHLFARELDQARNRGPLQVAATGAAGIWDVMHRGAYERVRASRTTAVEHHDASTRVPNHVQAFGLQSSVAHFGDSPMESPHMPMPTTRQLLGRHAFSFAIAFVALTSVLLYAFASRQTMAFGANGSSFNVLLLALPFVAAMTIPMAVFIAVIHQFSRMGINGTLAAALRVPDGVRRLVMPVLAAAAGIAVLALVVTAEIVPRSNERLSVALRGETTAKHDRTMTIGELRDASREVGPGSEVALLARAAAYEVEVQKKLALPAACLVLALAGMAIAFRMPSGGISLVFVASLVMFGAYYLLLMTGEALADHLVVSPFVGMWGANAFVLTAAIMTAWRRRAPGGLGAVPIRN